MLMVPGTDPGPLCMQSKRFTKEAAFSGPERDCFVEKIVRTTSFLTVLALDLQLYNVGSR